MGRPSNPNRRAGGAKSVIVDHEAAEEDALEQQPHMRFVVRVETTHAVPSFTAPWDREFEVQSASSGFIVDTKRRLLLTTAGAVEWSRRITVTRAGSELHCPATVVAACPDCDAALLTVENPRFWEGAEGVTFGGLPHLRDAVVVAGFPIGGDTYAVTSGVVSRVEVIEYAHSGRHLLGLQVDAPLNMGAWGGPLFDRAGRCVGMALQKFDSESWWERYCEDLGVERFDDDEWGDSEGHGGGGGSDGDEDEDGSEDEGGDAPENVGYAVPTSVLLHFLEDYGRNGRAVQGFPNIGIVSQGMESLALRRYFGLAPHEQGLLIREISPTSCAMGVLQPDDVLLTADGIPISCDGTIPFRCGERISFTHAVAARHVGEIISIEVLRSGQRVSLDIPLSQPRELVPPTLGGKPPQYVILSGFAFAAFSVPFMYDFDPADNTPKNAAFWGLIDSLQSGQPAFEGEEVVVLAGVLPGCDATEGWEEAASCPVRLLTVNGTSVRNLEHLAQLAITCAAEHREAIPKASGADAASDSSSGTAEGGGILHGDASSSSAGCDPLTATNGSGSELTLSKGFIRLGMADGKLLAIDAATMAADTIAALKASELSHALSNGIRSRLGTNWPFASKAAAGGGGRLRVQRARGSSRNGRLGGG